MGDGNPLSRIRQEWSGTQSVYGKVGTVLFYSLVWFNILSSIWSLFDPTSQGGECLLRFIKGDEGRSLFVATFRIAMVVTVGFFTYAHDGGLRVRNVAIVAAVVIICCAMGAREVRRLGCPHATWYALGPFAWSSLALVLAYLESVRGCRAVRGSGEEPRPHAE